MLCATLGPPAANIPPIPPLQPGQTNRQRIDTLTSGCGASCHNDMINPLGFSFEHFDGMGQFRDTENGGLPIDSSGSYTFADGNTRSWNDAAGLMQVLASTPQTHTCYAKKLASFGSAARHRGQRHAAAQRADGEQHGVHRLGQADDRRPRQERRVPHPRRRDPVKRKPEGTKDSVSPIINRETGKLYGFRPVPEAPRSTINRRAFLRGAGTVAIGLPFLEGLPERSAWAASSPPVFSFFMVAACGVVGNRFFPTATGALSSSALSSSGTAVAALAPHAANLLFIKNLNFPNGGPKSCGHAEGLCQSLTAIAPGSTGSTAYSGGISADMVIAQAVNGGADPFTLYAGAKNYIAERISFKGGRRWTGAGGRPQPLHALCQGRRADDDQQHRHHHDGSRSLPSWPPPGRASMTWCAAS